MQQIIRDRFIAVTDAEKMGLPRVLDSIEVSCKFVVLKIKLNTNILRCIYFQNSLQYQYVG